MTALLTRVLTLGQTRGWYYLTAAALLAVPIVAVYAVFFTPIASVHDALHPVRHAFTGIGCH